MTPTEYLEQSARTAADRFHANRVPYLDWEATRQILFIELDILDKIKKGLFYNRTTGMEDPDQAPMDTLCPDTLHAVLGILTEGGELLELLDDDTVSKDKWKDEISDILWYIALLLRTKGLTFEEVMDANIRKLRARFPDKFDASLAVNRDEEQEMLAVKG